MSFRIFQVSADGVAWPVSDKNASDRSVPTTIAAAPTASGTATAGARTVPVENTVEWAELRERLRQQTPPKPSRKSWRGR